jgi:ppGpp synthetase/RelA/SpoT-type nucleotidyltranferase
MKIDDYENSYVSTYTEFAEVVRFLLKDAIAKTEGIPRLQSTKSRGKEVTSLKLKLAERGLLASERIESETKDLAGVRLIFYTNTDIDRFLNSGLIPYTYDVDWKETRIHHPTDDNDQQRYQAIHYTVSLSEQHTALPEYKKFKGMRCEIQIQTILNHAWAETYHDMLYKARGSQGFGTDAQQALDKRMKKIMDDYLRPAGYEFQKVLHDYERFMQGKALFDRGTIETLESCDNNKELIDRLPEDDPKLSRIDICLSNPGVVNGEFGMVTAYRKKKEEISLWQNDSRPKVREFAASYAKSMEQRIASEQRSAEIRKELRMRDYELESE